MARLVKVGDINELTPGQGKLVQVDGQDIALFNVKTGECSADSELLVTTYVVKTEGNDLLIEVA